MEFWILGPFEVVEEGQPLALAVGKQRALLAILLLHANEVVSRDRLIDGLWGEQAPASAPKSIQIYVSQLRKALDEGGARLRTRPNGYELRVEHDELDLNRFQDLVDEGRRAPPGESAAKFRAALALWRGPALADFRYESFAQAEMVRLEELRLAVLEERVEADLALGRQAELVGELEALVAAHPLRERLRALLMLALYRSGRQAEALQVYQQTRDVLVDELGLEPSRELQGLEQAILRQDPSLDLSQTAGAPSGTVTMVFTDIEASTTLVRQLGEQYEHVLTTHCRLLRNAFGEAGGTEIDRQGDAFFFVVSRAKDAVLGAATAQRAFARETWPDGTTVRVRIGIHTGEPGLGVEGYHGLGVVRAARICAAGHGGQVLISRATKALIEDEALEGIDVRDLGEHQLKDMPHAERLFQLVGSGLVDDFPPLRAEAAAPATLVAGTEEQLAEVARAAVARQPTVVERLSRRAGLLVAAGAVLFAAAIVGAFVFTRGSGSGGIDHVDPNSVGAIDLKSNKILAQVPVGTRPGPIVYGHGQLWVANLDDNTVSRVDPKTWTRTDTVTLGARPDGIAAQREAIWVATDGGIKSIDPTFDNPTTLRVEVAKPHGALFSSWPTAVVFTPGSAWVVIGAHLTRADPKTGRGLARVPTGNAPAAVASGADKIWVTDVFDNTVTRVDRTGAIIGTTPVGRSPNSIAVGPDAVWVADAEDDDVKRIDPQTGAVVTTIPVGRHPSGVALSAGAVWVANQYDGTIWRIDPRTYKVAKEIDVGGSPVGLAVASGSLWFSVQANPLASNASLAKGGGVAQIDLDMHSIDPADENSYYVQDVQREYATCAKLLNYPDKRAPAGAQLQPEIARTMPTRSQDGKTYTFTIRKGFRFSPPSNQPVTAETMRYTIERSLSPYKKGALAPGYVGDIVGERAYEKKRSRHIAGLVVRGNTLTIELTRPAGDFLTRISMPFFCAVPTNMPLRRTERAPFPSAGPYYVASHTLAQTVLKRNPNYMGPRPHRLRAIVYTSGLSKQHSVARVLSRNTDYLPDPPSKARLNIRYGVHSPAAQRGHQQLFINPGLELDALALNTRRPLFANNHLRKAVNYAISRRALALYGGINFGSGPLSATVTDQLLPPGMPGFVDRSFYPLDGDIAKAKQLAGKARRKAVLYTCDFAPCPQQAQIIKTALAAIGITVEITTFKLEELLSREQRRSEPYDIGLMTWGVDNPDPFNVLNLLLSSDFEGQPQAGNFSHFHDPVFNAKLAAAAMLSGSRRYSEYARLDAELTGDAAPMVPYANATKIDFFSKRIGCQLYNPIYGMDVAALCIKPVSRSP